ncbi:MAG: universal stress protein [Verrucomicrobia bacterium]|nr:universal stress protein [Verrucomicrobiota bacterium]
MNGNHRQTTTVVQLKRGTLKRVLGVFDLFAIGYGDLGSSIFYALGVTALFALGATPIALALAGVVFICTALTYAEMTSAVHESGGSASFARHAFNDLISFIAGWGLLLDYIVTIAISAFAVGPYLGYFFADLHNTPVQLVFTVALIAILFAMNVIGVRQSTRISLILTTFTVLVQAVIIAIGLSTLLDLNIIVDHVRINVPNVDWSPSWPDFFKGVAMAMVAYTGIESIAQLAAEAQKPVKTVPRAVVLTMFVLLVVYLGISVAALSAVTPHDLGTKFLLNPIAAIVDALPFGGWILSPTVAILAAIVLGVAANAGLMGASRLSFNMGEYYQLPRFFYTIHPRFRTPIVSLAFFAIVASFVVLASRGSMDFLADLYNFGAMLAFFSAHMSLIAMRIKKPNMKRPFRAPLNIPFGKYSIPLTAIIGAIATMSVWFLVVITKPEGRYLGLAWMTFGLYMYYRIRKGRKLKPMGHVAIEEIDVPDYQPMAVKRILVPTRGGMQTETVQMACEIAKMHKARITALQVIEIPSSIPLDMNIPHRMVLAEAVLKRAEAIAREIGVEIELEIVRSRSVSDTILEMATRGKYDLIVLGALKSIRDPKTKGMGPVAEKIIRKAPCRVWVCASDVEDTHFRKTLLT